MERRAFDVHSHVVPPALHHAAQNGETVFGMEMSASPDGRSLKWSRAGVDGSMGWEPAFSDVGQRIRDMDRDGIGMQALSINPGMFGYTETPSLAASWAMLVNDGIAEMAAEAPDRFVALVHLPMQDPQACVKELERTAGYAGVAGASIGTNVAGENLDLAELGPVFEAAEALDMMLFIHPAADRFPLVGHPHFLQNLVGHPVETTMALASLIFGGVFDRHPALRVCLAHGGGYGCMALARFDHARRVVSACNGSERLPSDYRSQVFADSLTHGYPGLELVVDQLGASQCVLGTDYPTPMSQAHPVDWVEAADCLDSETKKRILHGNATTLLGSRAPSFLFK